MGYIGLRRSQVRSLPATKVPVAQWQGSGQVARPGPVIPTARICRVVKARVTSYNGCGFESRQWRSYCSSNGRAKRSGRWFPLQKDFGVVKVRVTSVERPDDESGRVRVRCSLALRKKSRSKDRPLLLRGSSSKEIQTRADGSHRKRKVHSRF